MDTGRGITHGPERTHAAALSMVPTAERDMEPGTTPVPALTRAALPRGDQAAQGAPPRPGILAPARTEEPDRAPMCMGAGARPGCGVVISGPRPLASPTAPPARPAGSRKAAVAGVH